jgi:hypothetical protein
MSVNITDDVRNLLADLHGYVKHERRRQDEGVAVYLTASQCEVIERFAAHVRGEKTT